MRVSESECECESQCFCVCVSLLVCECARVRVTVTVTVTVTVSVCMSVFLCVCAEWGGGEGVTFRLHFRHEERVCEATLRVSCIWVLYTLKIFVPVQNVHNILGDNILVDNI